MKKTYLKPTMNLSEVRLQTVTAAVVISVGPKPV
jgi:hypothetical protein